MEDLSDISLSAAAITAAIKSTSSLSKTVNQDRNETPQRLQYELKNLATRLESLLQVINTQTSMHTSEVPGDPFHNDDETTKDIAHNLGVQLQQLTIGSTKISGPREDLEDEKAVIEQCMVICEYAEKYIGSLKNSGLFLPHNSTQITPKDDGVRSQTPHTLAGNPNNNITIPQSQEDTALTQGGHRFGQVVAENGANQTLVVTLKGPFNIGNVRSTGRSSQFVGSMTSDDLRLMMEGHY
ncbi:uncharacterized protein BDV17DRAFT_274167, partial [Aspergillus undulatus]|uniref:uncharacterized protein n=1 Tax=Aspergillus undulatus TaxID=1810928 RepID=UPI003CCCE6C8